MERTRNLRLPKDAGLIARTFLEYCISQDELYERITCGVSNTPLRDQMIGMVEGSRNDDEAPQGWPEGSWQVYLSIVCSMPLHAYQAWVASGKAMPSGEMVDVTTATTAAASKAFEAELLPRSGSTSLIPVGNPYGEGSTGQRDTPPS